MPTLSPYGHSPYKDPKLTCLSDADPPPGSPHLEARRTSPEPNTRRTKGLSRKFRSRARGLGGRAGALGRRPDTLRRGPVPWRTEPSSRTVRKKGRLPAEAGGPGGGSAARLGSPRWPRILRMTSPASIVAITDMRPPQRGQASTSRSKTRRIRSAQAQSRGFSGARGRLSSGGDTAPVSGVRSKAPAPGSSPARGRFSIVDPAEPRATTWARARACGARIPSNAREPSAERAAGQELSELALDEPRQTAPSVCAAISARKVSKCSRTTRWRTVPSMARGW